MTFVGKILVVVQVMLSIFFMAFAGAVYTAHSGWKGKHDDVAKQLADEKTDRGNERDALEKEKDVLVKSGKAARDQAAVLAEQVKTLTTEKVALETELKDEKIAKIKEQSLADRFTAEGEFRRSEANAQRTRNAALLDAREQLVAEVQRLKDEKFTHETELNKLIEKHNLVLLEVDKLKTIVAVNGLSTDPRDYEDDKPPPPSVEGFVLQAEREKRSGPQLIEITLGSDDGLQEGHELHVSREGKYLGRIRIVHLEADRSVGTLFKPTRNGSIQRGDNVRTQL